ncbi:MAG: hypothetical protein OXG15_12510 [Gammaproteobacteria bacterium]|nr:hypothetical protein [Gammaproteobacteria bacterium]
MSTFEELMETTPLDRTTIRQDKTRQITKSQTSSSGNEIMSIEKSANKITREYFEGSIVSKQSIIGHLNYGFVLGRGTLNSVIIDRLRQKLRDELNELKKSVTFDNWDGEGAPRIQDSAFDNAIQFIESLPIQDINTPDIYATPHGAIVFSWESKDLKDTFEVLLLPSGEIATSGIFDRLEVIGRVERNVKGINRLCDLMSWISRD